ncbi:MAG: dUTP diphosphatase [Neomegalonema sp.]|nr:dUTP diphosphatase [Neomegalonema sp.]
MLTEIPIAIKVLPHGLGVPSYGSAGAAGADLAAAIQQPVDIEAGERMLVPTGIAIALPEGWEGQVRPRSGLAIKLGLTTLNTPGTIDWDYRGEIKVILINHGLTKVTLNRGDRIAQLVICPVARAKWQVSNELGDTTRGQGGFGSTGIRGQ